MSDKQYQIILDLFNEFPKVFYTLPSEILDAYYKRLFS